MVTKAKYGKSCANCGHYFAEKSICTLQNPPEKIKQPAFCPACDEWTEREIYSEKVISQWENLVQTAISNMEKGLTCFSSIEASDAVEQPEPENVKVKSICNNCFWWNKTCHNKESCCYGEYKDYNGFCGWFEPANAEMDIAAEIFKAQNHDAVNHPSHYTSGGIECIDAIKAATADLTGIQAVCAGNAIKYIWRFKYKNGAEDIRKAIWYLERLLVEIGTGEE